MVIQIKLDVDYFFVDQKFLIIGANIKACQKINPFIDVRCFGHGWIERHDMSMNAQVM